ncbi:MAG: zf-HC2 domain-containing protein [Acidobacteriia bacterium]|nr:zf-HC2 domain-containing protein [Terriglobia bacterium]
MFENCLEIRGHFSDYLDRQCNPDTLRSIRFHLAYCEACRKELGQWESNQAEIRTLPRRRVPPDLALRLRVQFSRQLHRRFLSHLWVRLENALQPLLLPASGGVLAAIVCFCLFMGSRPMPANDTPDVPLQLVTPPRVQVLAPIDFNTGDKAVVMVIPIDAAGQVRGYRILSGQNSPELMHQLDRIIYFSTFQPATRFGMPTDGQVVLSLRRITVRG